MAGSAPGSVSQAADGEESVPVEEEFQEARDGASQQLEGSVDRDFPDAVPLDPPYFESQQEARSVMFGLSAEVAQYLDQGSGSDPSEGTARGAPGLAPRARTAETVARLKMFQTPWLVGSRFRFWVDGRPKDWDTGRRIRR